MRRIIIVLAVLLLSSPVLCDTLYVDYRDGYCTSCSEGNDTDYDPATRDCGSGSDTVYSTIQAAVTATDGKDMVYIREGTYNEIDIDLPKEGGDAWTAGNYSWIGSYVGEWAIIDASGMNTDGDEWNTAVFGNLSNYTPSSMNEATHYWIIERLEITGGRCGILMKPAPMKFRYLYIHDNETNPAGVDTLHSGILVVNSQDSYYEYCYIKDNEPGGSPGSLANNAGILLVADYRDTTGAGESFDTTLGTQRNIIRYCYIYGHNTGITHKNQQRFGVNARDPDPITGDMTSYLAYGDDVHHNIILDASNMGYIGNQDYQQIHNNILDKRLWMHGYHEYPMTYGYACYNNTIRTAGGSSGGGINSWSAINEGVSSIGDYGTAYYNCYDTYSEEVRVSATAHPWIWCYNNIVTGTDGTGDESVPFQFLGDTPGDEDPVDWDASNLVVDRNYVNGVTPTDNWIVGSLSSGYDDGTCPYLWHTVSEFNTCQDAWRSTSGTANYDNDTANMWAGESGASQYIVSGSYSDYSTISNGGIGGNHPYLSGVTIPSYIGAVNPSDSDWVAGVLGLDATYFTSAAAGSDPSWIEGESSGSSPAVSGNGVGGSGVSNSGGG